MGCCGDTDEEDDRVPNNLTQPLIPSDSSSDNSAESLTIISPMNSHFTALTCPDTLRLIFEKLPVADLARASCVCRVWKTVSSEDAVVKTAFMRPWKLKGIIGKPVTGGSFWRDGLRKFAISHKIGKGDTVAGLAVKYSVQVMNIKRLNNMMSDHGIHSRYRLLIPLSSPDLLINSTCYIELDAYANREVAVLYLDGEPDKSHSFMPNRRTSDYGKKKILESIKRSMQIDDGTAQYYLSVSNGDPRAAINQLSEDLRWERRAELS
ncbi:F-box protein At1g55000 [Mercurialis annua]|uniref:F-box protein At1g55000 n=1 Tax=Mercurialis annua TaxID=3986 RepID=UPI002160394D|nr:F-box protein At1g55000 [Mercurialis annua]